MPEKINDGYILLSRKITNSDIFKKPPLYAKVWVYLLAKAQHSDYKGLKRGQIFTSIEKIREDLSWYVGYRKVTPTKDEIYNIIRWLRFCDEGNDEHNNSTTMITTTKATHGLLISIENYSFYQDPKNYEDNDEGNDEKATKDMRPPSPSNNINKNVTRKNKNEQLKEGGFTPPTVSEVSDFITEMKYGVDAQRFVSFYASKNWMVGKNKMKDWRSAVTGWNTRDNKTGRVEPIPDYEPTHTEKVDIDALRERIKRVSK